MKNWFSKMSSGSPYQTATNFRSGVGEPFALASVDIGFLEHGVVTLPLWVLVMESITVARFF